jgi:hypothetical protein
VVAALRLLLKRNRRAAAGAIGWRAAGGGYATRQLYSDTDEVLLALQRPVILTSIEDVVTRGDLADRAISIMLAPIEENCRRSDAELHAAYDAARPSILGALLNAVVHGLKRLPHVRLDRLPRMADFALWATACETALWRTGTFGTAYRNNRTTAIDTVIEADGIAFAVRALMADRTEWTGTTAELLAALAGIAGERAARAREWPATPRALAGRLRRVGTGAAPCGIHIAHAPRRGRMRPIIITRSGADPATDDTTQSGEAADRHDRHHRHAATDFSHLRDDSRDDVSADRNGGLHPTVTIDATPASSKVNGIARRDDNGDDGDDVLLTHSAPANWADDQDERVVEHDGGKAPRTWAEAFARLDPAKPPAGISPPRWLRFIGDGHHFLDAGWAARAAEFGWSSFDLFGCDRKRPFARVDNMGLVWFVNGGTIVALRPDGAVIETRMRARQSYRRRSTDTDRVVLAWELSANLD